MIMVHEIEFAPSRSDEWAATNAALECLAWSTPNYREDGEPAEPETLDRLGYEWSQESRVQMLALVAGFIEANSASLEGLEYSQIGHDFILTANRHGTGFWDRGLGERGDRLTEMAHPYGDIGAWANHKTHTLELEY